MLGLSFPGPERFDSRVLASYPFLGAAVGAWMLARWIDPPRRRLQLGPSFIWMQLLGLILLSMAGIPFAFDGRYACMRILYLGLACALYMMIVNSQFSPATMVGPLAASIVLQALVALVQFRVGGSIGLGVLGERHLDPGRPSTSIVMVGSQRILRAYGLTLHPNVLGGYLMASLLIIVGYYLGGSRRRMVLLGPLALGFSALLVSYSRAAWLGTAIGGLGALMLVTFGASSHRLNSAMVRWNIPSLSSWTPFHWTRMLNRANVYPTRLLK